MEENLTSKDLGEMVRSGRVQATGLCAERALAAFLRAQRADDPTLP